jgi:hypothetical protein
MMLVGCHEASIRRYRACLIVIEHEQPYRQREVARAGVGYRCWRPNLTVSRGGCWRYPSVRPERVLKADTRLVPRDDDGALHDG